MNLENFFTEYDDTIIGDTKRDPLGMQIIWSALGQQIFHKNITSISDNLRNFTINLFNHLIIKEVVNDDEFQLNAKQNAYYGGKGTVNFKAGLVIFLENLLLSSLLFESNKSLNTFGLLGANVAGAKIKDKGEKLSLFIQKEKGFLVRQISLGINGRYKTPFILANFFKDDYHYIPDQWDDVSTELIKHYPESEILKNEIKKIIHYAIISCEAPPINLTLNQIFNKCKGIQELYFNCFGNFYNVVDNFRQFWIEKLEMNKGTAKLLFDALKSYVDVNYDSYDKKIMNIVHAAHNDTTDEENKKHLNAILQTEPFLAQVEYMFRTICATSTNNIMDVENHLQKKDGYMDGLRDNSNLEEFIDKKKSPEAYRRLKELTQINYQNAPEAIQKLYDYHNCIMKSRELYPWFTINGKKVRHIVKAFSPKDLKKPVGLWIHRYYIDTLDSLFFSKQEEKNEAT